LREKGIQHAASPPYHPQYQGKVERMNRTISEMAHSMRSGAGLSTEFWELAWDCAVFIRNRVPTAANVGGMTPYEALLGRQPRLDNLRVFGCRAEAMMHGKMLRKGADRSVPGIFVGYDESSCSFKFLPDRTRKWVPVRTLVCEERMGPTEVKAEQRDGDFLVRGLGESVGVAKGDGEARWQEEEEEVEEDMMEYEAQKKGEERPQLVAAKSVQMQTRVQMKKRLAERHVVGEEVALVGIDCLGGELFAGGGIQVEVPRSIREAMAGGEWEHWRVAIEEEMLAMEEAQVWGPPVVVQKGVKVTPLRFVFAKKLGADGEVERFKARLIFQNRDDGELDGEDCYAPVVDKVSLRIFLTTVAQRGWSIQQSDVKTAFLNAENSGVDYVRLPKCVVEGNESPVRLLKKALYGLRRAPKAWNTTFTAWALENGFEQSEADPCLFTHGRMRAMLVIYVDDLLVAGETDKVVLEVQQLLGGKFRTRDMGQPAYFLGMNLSYNRNERQMKLYQRTYIEALTVKFADFLGMPRSLPIGHGVQLTKDQGVEQPTENPYASLVGALLFIAVCTRPDVSFTVGLLTKFVSCPGEAHWRVAIDLLSYLGATKTRGVLLGRVGNGVERGLIGFADSDWANDVEDRKSISGGAIFVDGGLVAWYSRKQQMVCTSTAEAEIHAVLSMVNAVRIAGSVLNDVQSIFGEKVQVPVIFSDNQPGIDAIKSGRARTKHYDVKVKFIAEAIQMGEFQLRKVSTVNNIADVFTKALRGNKFRAVTNKFLSM
jgi:hypothetical protein